MPGCRLGSTSEALSSPTWSVSAVLRRVLDQQGGRAMLQALQSTRALGVPAEDPRRREQLACTLQAALLLIGNTHPHQTNIGGPAQPPKTSNLPLMPDGQVGTCGAASEIQSGGPHLRAQPPQPGTNLPQAQPEKHLPLAGTVPDDRHPRHLQTDGRPIPGRRVYCRHAGPRGWAAAAPGRLL